jgi:hypothetical protein
VSILSVENRTRTYQSRKSRSFDDQFDRQLPRQARSELLKEIQESAPPPPPKKVIYRTPSPDKRGKGVAIIGAIAIVAIFLYAVFHTGAPSTSTALPESRSVPTPSMSRPVEVRRALPVEVRRALPAVPRALPLTFPVSPVSNMEWQPVRFADGTAVWASYQGELPSSAALPLQGRFIGEEYSTGNTSWIWMTPAEE